MKYDPRTKEVSVLLEGLAFPNGVALSDDSSFLVVAESGNFQILKFWLRGSKSSRTTEVFSPLKRSPDNIKKNSKGEFWVALNSGREIQNVGALVHETESVVAWPGWGTKDIVAAKYDAEGKVIGVVDGNGGNSLDSVSEVEEHNGYLWIGSAVKPYVGVIRV